LTTTAVVAVGLLAAPAAFAQTAQPNAAGGSAENAAGRRVRSRSSGLAPARPMRLPITRATRRRARASRSAPWSFS